MLSVVATKIRASRDCGGTQSPIGRDYEGYLLAAPTVGRGMVLFRDANGRRMVTTPVRRVLRDSSDRVFYVETENSVYRLFVREAAGPVARDMQRIPAMMGEVHTGG